MSDPGQWLDSDLGLLFAAEAEQRLSQLAFGLAELGDRGSDPSLLESLFDHAHTLKAASAVVRLDDVARVAHAMEEVLAAAGRGQPLGPAEMETLLGAVEGLRAAVPMLLAGSDISALAALIEKALLDLVIGQATRWPPRPTGRPTAPPPAVPITAQPAVPVTVTVEPAAPAGVEPAVPTARPPVGCVLVVAGGQRYAIATASIVVVLGGADAPDGGSRRSPVWVDEQPVTVTALAGLLGPARTNSDASTGTNASPSSPIVVLEGSGNRHGFAVDALDGQRDLAVEPLSQIVPGLAVVAGAAIEPDGRVLCVLDGPGLVDAATNLAATNLATATRG